MRQKVAQATVVLSLILTIGGHWFLLQSVAWVSMFAQFTQSCSVAEALVRTFNGKNPCELCLAVQHGKQSEEKQATVKVETKLDLLLQDRAAIGSRPSFGSFLLTPPDAEAGLARFERPPTPPPRVA